MPSWSEVVADRAEGHQEPLRLPRRLEALHRPLALAHRPMLVLRSVVQPFVPPMLAARKHPSDGRHVARQLVRDDHPRLDAVLAVEHPMQEPLGGLLVTPTLNEDLEDRPILVDGTPEPVPVFVDRERHLVQEPLVATPPRTPAT